MHNSKSVECLHQIVYDMTRFYNFDHKDSYKFDLKLLFFLGLDIPKHGEPAYPLASYGDGWGSGKSPATETMELPFTLQLKSASPHEGPSPTPVQNGLPSMPGPQELAIL